MILCDIIHRHHSLCHQVALHTSVQTEVIKAIH